MKQYLYVNPEVVATFQSYWTVKAAGEGEYYTQYEKEDYNIEIRFTRKEKPFVPGYFRAVNHEDGQGGMVHWFKSQPLGVGRVGWKRVVVTDDPGSA